MSDASSANLSELHGVGTKRDQAVGLNRACQLHRATIRGLRRFLDVESRGSRIAPYRDERLGYLERLAYGR